MKMDIDIIDKKRREKGIQKQFLTYDLEDGNCYINVE
jgi:hypothetical protein